MISHLHIKYELNKYDGIITFCDKIIRRLIWPKKKKNFGLGDEIFCCQILQN